MNDNAESQLQAVRKIPLNRAVRETLLYEMDNDDSIFLMGEDIGMFGGVYQTATGFLERYGEARVRDTPISESAFMAAATGAAMYGLKPIVELMFIDFIGVCLDPIYNAAAKGSYHTAGKQPVPMVIMAGIGGGYSDASQHSQTLYATVAHLPGIKVVVPSNAYDARGLLHAAIKDPNPVIYMIHKRLTGMGWFEPIKEAAVDVPKGYYEVQIGKARVVQEGSDVTLIGWGETAWTAISAAKELQTLGISAEVVDLRSIVPLDEATLIASVTKTGRVIAIDEDYRNCGVAAEIVSRICESTAVKLKSPPVRITFPDVPIPYARPLEQFARPSAEQVVAAAKGMMEGAQHD